MPRAGRAEKAGPTYRLKQLPEAQTQVQGGHTRGKVVVTV
jgi:hypothetical protein